MLTRPTLHSHARHVQPLRIPVPSPPSPDDLLADLNRQYAYSSPAQSPLSRASPSPSIETPASPFHPLLASRPHFFFDPLPPSSAMDFSRVLQLQTQAAYKRGSIDATTQTQPQAIPAPVPRHPAALRSESSSDSSSSSTSTSTSPLPSRRLGSISSPSRGAAVGLTAGKCSKCMRAFSTDANAADQPLTLSNSAPICHRCAMAMVFGG